MSFIAKLAEAEKSSEGRLEYATKVQALFPDHSACAHCHWPWGALNDHTTMIDKSRGCFPLCEGCWKELRKAGRDEDIRAYYHHNRLRYG